MITRTDERPEGFACDETYIDTFCANGNPTDCSEPDRDGDGFVDIVDNCPNTFATSNDGCPQGVTTDPKECEVIIDGICVKGTMVVVPSGGSGGVCSESNPSACNNQFGSFDTTTLLILGGVGLIVVGVIVAVVKRR